MSAGSRYRWKHGAPRTVFISGGSSGIGRDMARRLAAEGADIALFNRSAAEDVLAELRAAAKHPAQRFAACRADVAEAGSIEAAVRQAVAELGAPDLAINSAGVIHARPLQEASAQDFERVIDINLKSSPTPPTAPPSSACAGWPRRCATSCGCRTSTSACAAPARS